MLGDIGARGKQKLVVVDLSIGRKSRRYNRGKVDGAQVQGALAGAPQIFFCKSGVSSEWRHAQIALSLMVSDDSNESLVGYGKRSLLRSHRRASG